MNDFFVLDKDSHIPVFSGVCTYCRHLDSSGERKCAAFPETIPLPIWLGENDHRLPYDGDHGIRFAPLRSAEKLIKARKRRFLTRPYLEQDAKLRARLWQNPQIRENIVAEILGLSLVVAEAKDISVIETRWLNQSVAVKAKHQKHHSLTKK